MADVLAQEIGMRQFKPLLRRTPELMRRRTVVEEARAKAGRPRPSPRELVAAR